MANKLTNLHIECMAKEIRDLLLKEEMWMDVTIYFNGKAFSTDDRKGTFAYNDPKKLIVLQDMNPADYLDYSGGVIDMSFEGYFYQCINGYSYRSTLRKFEKILKKYDCYWEQGASWSLSVYPIK